MGDQNVDYDSSPPTGSYAPSVGPFTSLLTQYSNQFPSTSSFYPYTSILRSDHTCVIRDVIEEDEHTSEGVEADSFVHVSLERENEEENTFFREVDGIGEREDDEHLEPSSHSEVPEFRRMHESTSEIFQDINQDDSNYVGDLERNRMSITWDPMYQEPAVGYRFKDKDSLKHAFKTYGIRTNNEHVVVDTNSERWILRCKASEISGCKWRIRAIKSKKHGMWVITKYEGPHSCLYARDNQDHKHLDSEFISRYIVNRIRAEPSLSISVIIAEVNDEFKHTVSYRKAWKAKQKAISMVFGDWDISYRMLPKFLNAVSYFNPGSIVRYWYSNTQNQGEAILHRVFWTFKPAIDGFVHCRPVISIDGTHLYGKYKGKFLIATSCDAGRSIYPLAFAIVAEESTETWLWFLQLLRQHVVPSRQNLCIISDRHAGIIAAIKTSGSGWEPPFAKHRYCLKHLESNFNAKFKGPKIREMYWQAAMSRQVRKFRKVMEKIQIEDMVAYKYLTYIELEKWTLAYDGGMRYGLITTNLSEVLNNVMKGARNLPVTALAEMTFYKLVNYFEKGRIRANKLIVEGVKYPKKVVEAMSSIQSKARGHGLKAFNQSEGYYEVLTRKRGSGGGNVQIVRLNEGRCSCSKWLLYHLPCSHVMAVCQKRRINWMQYVDPIYTVQSMVYTYTPQFQALPHEDYWPSPSEPIFVPNPNLLRAKGRPKATRFRNNMDQSRQAAGNKCGICKEVGHNRRKCREVSEGATPSQFMI